SVQDEVSRRFDLESVDALEAQRDGPWIRPGGDDEVVLELALIAVEDQVHPWIHALVRDPGVGRNVLEPAVGIVAEEVVDSSALLFAAFDPELRPATDQLHAESRWGSRRVVSKQVHDDLARREEQRVARSACHELDGGISLTSVGLEAQGQSPEPGGEPWLERFLAGEQRKRASLLSQGQGDGTER